MFNKVEASRVRVGVCVSVRVRARVMVRVRVRVKVNSVTKHLQKSSNTLKVLWYVNPLTQGVLPGTFCSVIHWRR